MQTLAAENLSPDRFCFWQPSAAATVAVGPERQPFILPDYPLPVHRDDMVDGTPSDAAIGQGTYDYLRQFPDCAGNRIYAELLRDAYPHFLSDLASLAVMIDAKQVDPAFVARKLNCLKILLLLEPDNQGLLGQLCRGYFDLALDYAELPRCRRHLLDAMRFGQDLLKLAPHDMLALSVLAEIDWLFGDTPAAVAKWRTLSAQIGDAATAARIDRRIEVCNGEIRLDAALVDDLELLAEAVHLHAIGDNPRALRLLERLEGEGFLMKALPSAEFFWLLGTCRRECGDPSGAAVAWNKALEIEPEHTASLAALASAPGV